MLKKYLPQISLFFTLLLLTVACSESLPLEDNTSLRYQVGDQWTYFNRPGEDESTIIITKIDKTTINEEEIPLIHIAVIGLAIDHPAGGQVTAVPHLAIVEEALHSSARERIGVVDPIPQEYLDAYQTWADRFQKGDAPIFNTSITSALDDIQASLPSP